MTNPSKEQTSAGKKAWIASLLAVLGVVIGSLALGLVAAHPAAAASLKSSFFQATGGPVQSTEESYRIAPKIAQNRLTQPSMRAAKEKALPLGKTIIDRLPEGVLGSGVSFGFFS